jgi:hypothetical protein
MVAPSLRAVGPATVGATLTPTFTAPAGAVPTDVIMCLWFQGDARTSIGAFPAGFVNCPDLRQNNGVLLADPGHSLMGYYGRFQDVGPGPYQFTVNSGTGGVPFIEGYAVAVKDCILTGSPFGPCDGNTSGAAATQVAPLVSVASLIADSYAFYAATNWSGGAWTPAAGFAEVLESPNRILTFGEATLAVPQVVSPQAVCTGNNLSNAWVGVLLPIPPAPPTQGPDPDLCAGPPFTSWNAGSLGTDWAAGAPFTGWQATGPEEC